MRAEEEAKRNAERRAAEAVQAAEWRTTQLQVAISVAAIAVIAFFVLKERNII